jgi:hypothetical protein
LTNSEIVDINGRIDNNANICDNGASTCAQEGKEKNRTLVIAVVVPIAVATLLFVAAILILHRRRNKQGTVTFFHPGNH